ncbi:hypothetical protein BX666DRAFT_2048976, partial [Dichotomocladium elegans]
MALTEVPNDHRLAFRFPLLRRGITEDLSSSLCLLFRAFDSLPVSASSPLISSATALALPRTSAWFPAPGFLPSCPSLRRLCVGDMFAFDPTLQHLRLKTPTETSHPRLTSFFHAGLTSGRIVLLLFFLPLCLQRPSNATPPDSLGIVDASPFLEPFLDDDTHPPLTTRRFRALVGAAASTSALASPSTPAAWRLFWSFPLSPGVRNIWFRVLYGTLPTSKRLHLFNPTLMPSPACQICGAPQDTTEN